MTEPQTPGWYDDPWSPGSQRWWDGSKWTGYVKQPRGRKVWPWVLAGAGVLFLVLAGAAAAVLVATGAFSDDSKDTTAHAGTTTTTTTETTPPATAFEEPKSNKLPEASLGTPLELRTQEGIHVRVTALSVVDPVSYGSYTLRPKRGNRWVGVRMRFEDLGPGKLEDAPG